MFTPGEPRPHHPHHLGRTPLCKDIIILTYPPRNDFLPNEKNLNCCQVYGNDIPSGIAQDSWYTVIICQTTHM